MQDIANPHLVEAMRRHRKESAFLPRENEIRGIVEGIRAEEFRARQRFALPEANTNTEERCAKNMLKAQEILDSLFPAKAV